MFLFQSELFSSSLRKKKQESILLVVTPRVLHCLVFHPIPGSPGPPEHVKVEEITDTTAQISWQEGTDNHSPVTTYTIQARTPFSVGWQRATTGEHNSRPRLCGNVSGTEFLSSLFPFFFLVPDVIDGKTFTSTVVDLNPWVEYEFRVVASNKIGGGEPSLPSEKVRTEEAG